MFEGYKAKSYLCPASVVTIGWGSTMYTDGRKIKIGDTINEQQAEELLMWELKNKSIALYGLNLNQNQFDSLLSFSSSPSFRLILSHCTFIYHRS